MGLDGYGSAHAKHNKNKFSAHAKRLARHLQYDACMYAFMYLYIYIGLNRMSAAVTIQVAVCVCVS